MNLVLIYPIFRCLLYQLINLHQQLCSDCYFTNYLIFHANIMSLMWAKERAIWTDSLLACDANDFNFPIMLWTHLFHLLLLNLLRLWLWINLGCSNLLFQFFNLFDLPLFFFYLLLLFFFFFFLLCESYQREIPWIIFCCGFSSTFNATSINDTEKSWLTCFLGKRKVTQGL